MPANTTNSQQPQRSLVGREEFESLKAISEANAAALATITEKLDAISAVDKGRMRLSREQEQIANSPVHEYRDPDEDSIISHPALRAREGMAQIWVRLSIRGEVDSGNILRMCAPNRGWKPRSPDTLPPELASVMAKTFEGEPIIQYRDCALYERPLVRHQREVAARQHDADMHMHGIENDLRRVHVPGQPGFGSPAFVERRRRVEIGRRPEPE